MRSGCKFASAGLAVVVACMFFSTLFAAEVTEEYLEMYKYDSDLPLMSQVKETEDLESYIAYRVAYQSTDGQVVTAVLSIPKSGSAPYPVVVIGHGKAQSKTNMAPYAKMFAEQDPPMATIALDFIYHGERKEEGKDVYSPDIKANVGYFAQSIRDLMRTVDYVVTREEIDPERIGYMGYAMGGIFGGIFIALDKRIKAAAFVLTGGDWVKLVAQSAITSADPLRDTTATLANLTEILAPVEPNNYIGMFAPRPLLMINQKEDRIIPFESANSMFEAAGEPKEIIWLRGQHYIAPAETYEHVAPFFKMHLAGE